MEGHAIEKIVGGKLLEIKTSHDDIIHKVTILGDFFAHPEESIVDIEKMFSGLSKDFDSEELDKKIQAYLDKNHIEVIGFDVEDLLRLVKRALG